MCFEVLLRKKVANLMDTNNTIDDVRSFQRSRPKETALAIFSRPDIYDQHKLGKIIDVSLGGLSVQYIAVGDYLQELAEVEIIGAGDPRLRISGIKCFIIYDFKVIESSWGFLTVRRCGMSFKDLDPFRIKQLEVFIKNYTVTQ
jgi:hypothetical protein